LRAIPRLATLSDKRAFLLVLAGPQFGEIFPLALRRELLVGRGRDADVQIREDAVSRRHASLRVDGDGALVTDLGSANGTWVDGKRVPRAPVNDGSRIHVGAQTTLKFIWADELDALHQMKLAQRALRDPLTNLYNRRYVDERLGSEIASLHGYGKPLALLLVDIDLFKDVNDECGHLAGDEALETVASTLRRAVRKDDVLARYGGDEFVVISPETTLDGGCALGERIRSAVERSRSVGKGRELAVTVSVGVTIVNHRTHSGERSPSATCSRRPIEPSTSPNEAAGTGWSPCPSKLRSVHGVTNAAVREPHPGAMLGQEGDPRARLDVPRQHRDREYESLEDENESVPSRVATPLSGGRNALREAFGTGGPSQSGCCRSAPIHVAFRVWRRSLHLRPVASRHTSNLVRGTPILRFKTLRDGNLHTAPPYVRRDEQARTIRRGWERAREGDPAIRAVLHPELAGPGRGEVVSTCEQYLAELRKLVHSAATQGGSQKHDAGR
jgi:diguanylate cyclase (GGDEF)-like protein